jgi:hypothetical protein
MGQTYLPPGVPAQGKPSPKHHGPSKKKHGKGPPPGLSSVQHKKAVAQGGAGGYVVPKGFAGTTKKD